VGIVNGLLQGLPPPSFAEAVQHPGEISIHDSIPALAKTHEGGELHCQLEE
jgi:hypothetical protein